MPATVARPRERTRTAVERRHAMIRDLRKVCGYTIKALMDEYGLTKQQIINICKG